MTIWETLGIAPTHDEAVVRRAYAAGVKQWRPDTHPQEFARLRNAYEAALAHARAGTSDDTEQTTVPAGLEAASSGDTGAQARERPFARAEAMIAELGKRFSEGGEAAAVPLLREQFAQVSAGTVDGKTEWETVFVHSLLTAATPPLGLVFEGDRMLRWRDRAADVGRMLGDAAAQRLGLLLQMSYQAIYAVHFSPNPWQRRLFGSPSAPWFGMTSHVAVAAAAATHYGQLAQALSLEQAGYKLDPAVLRRLSGRMVLSTDVLFALALGWLFYMMAGDALWVRKAWMAWAIGAAVTVAVTPVPLLLRAFAATAIARRIWSWRKAFENVPPIVLVLAGAVVVIGSVIAFSTAEAPDGVRRTGLAVFGTFAAGMLSAVLYGAWKIIRVAEQLACMPIVSLQRTWGAQAFREVLAGLPLPSRAQRWKRLPGAAFAEWREARKERRAQRQREAAQREQAKRSGGSTYGQRPSFNFWWVIGAIMLLNMLARLGGR